MTRIPNSQGQATKEENKRSRGLTRSGAVEGDLWGEVCLGESLVKTVRSDR
jgi:hypothetical protein